MGGVIQYIVMLYGFLNRFDIEQIIVPTGGPSVVLYKARVVQSQAGQNAGRCEPSWPNHWVYCER